MEETLGRRISAARKAKGMTQDQLAEQLGLTAQAVSKWENDQSCPDITILPRLAEIFGTTTDALLGMTPPAGQADSAQPAEDPAEAEVAFRFDEEDPEEDDAGIEFRFENSRRGTLLLALWVMLVGGLMLLAQWLEVPAGLWDIGWSSGLMVFGLAGLYPRFSWLRLGCGLFGGYFLLNNFVPLPLGKAVVLPVLLLLLGLSLLADGIRRPKKPVFSFHSQGMSSKGGYSCTEGYSCTDGILKCSTSFGEATRRVHADLLRKGDASVSFGELILDLTGCQDFAPDCQLNLGCSFGNLELRLPRSCRAEQLGKSAFGNVEISGSPAADAKKTIFLNCSANFGQISVEYL